MYYMYLMQVLQWPENSRLNRQMLAQEWIEKFLTTALTWVMLQKSWGNSVSAL